MVVPASRLITVIVLFSFGVGCDEVVVGALSDSGGDTMSRHDTRAGDGVTPDATIDATPVEDDMTADLDPDGPAFDASGGGLCPGSAGFVDGERSGVYTGTAVVPGGPFTKAGTYPVTLTLAVVCGELRGILLINTSSNPLVVPSYKIKAKVSGSVSQVVLSDRYCGSVDCSPHLQHGAGMEIFTTSATFTKAKVSFTQAAIMSGVSYKDIEIPFTSLDATRTFPTQGKSATGPVAGSWKAKVMGTNEVLAKMPMYGDNTLTISSKLDSWFFGSYDVLLDLTLFPSKWLASKERRVGALQNAGGGQQYIYSAVLDGSWLIGVVRDNRAPLSGNLDVPTLFAKDDALWAIWIGHRP